MRTDGPSLTARGVAVARAALDRPASTTGDPAADDRLTRGLVDGLDLAGRPSRGDLASWVGVRTRFFDDVVLAALEAGTPQVVILGAGYDGRAVRFRTPGVRFFEVDHPETQRDKRARYDAAAVPVDDVTFVSTDFTDDQVGGALASAGHDADRPTLFLCEGVLRYLPEHSVRALLHAAAERAAPGSTLAVSISTREPGADEDDPRRAEQARRLAAIGEPVLTLPSRAAALHWLVEAGWEVEGIDEPDQRAPEQHAPEPRAPGQHAPEPRAPGQRARGGAHGRLLVLARR